MSGPSWLVVFDMDGTLLPGTTACQQIALAANDPLTVEQLESAYRRGTITSETFARRAWAAWSTAGPDLFRRAFDGAPKLSDIELTLARLREIGAVSCLITMAPVEFASLFTGFDHVFGSDYTGDILNPEDKPLTAMRLCEQLGVSRDRVIALGDSDSDVPLFRWAERTVAVNATPALSAMATWTYRGTSALAALATALPDLTAADVE